jgi:hypothetical protein
MKHKVNEHAYIKSSLCHTRESGCLLRDFPAGNDRGQTADSLFQAGRGGIQVDVTMKRRAAYGKLPLDLDNNGV